MYQLCSNIRDDCTLQNGTTTVFVASLYTVQCTEQKNVLKWYDQCLKTIRFQLSTAYQFYIIPAALAAVVYQACRTVFMTKNLSTDADSRTDTIWRGCVIYLKKIHFFFLVV